MRTNLVLFLNPQTLIKFYLCGPREWTKVSTFQVKRLAAELQHQQYTTKISNSRHLIDTDVSLKKMKLVNFLM